MATRLARRLLQNLVRRSGYEFRRIDAFRNRPIDVFELLVNQRIAERGASSFFVVQVGANDGSTHDPIHRFILKYGLRGLLVEPLPDFFERLKGTYADQAGLLFENVAIGSEEGTRALYRIRPGADIRDDAHCLASFDRGNLLKAKDRVPGIERHIDEISVPTMTMGRLFAKHEITNIDLLQVDTEGFDAEVIRMTLDSGFRPWMINFENMHLSHTLKVRTQELLTEAGYRYLNHGAQGAETIALRSDL